MNKQQSVSTSFRLSAQDRQRLAKLADLLGVSQAAVVRMLLREEARKRGVV